MCKVLLLVCGVRIARARACVCVFACIIVRLCWMWFVCLAAGPLRGFYLYVCACACSQAVRVHVFFLWGVRLGVCFFGCCKVPCLCLRLRTGLVVCPCVCVCWLVCVCVCFVCMVV